MSDEDNEIVVSGYATLTVSVRLECVTDEDPYGVPELYAHRHRVVVPDPQVTKAMNPDRCLSAGYVLGMELARVANKFRDSLADTHEIADGFAREMREWDTDHGKRR